MLLLKSEFLLKALGRFIGIDLIKMAIVQRQVCVSSFWLVILCVVQGMRGGPKVVGLTDEGKHPTFLVDDTEVYAICL